MSDWISVDDELPEEYETIVIWYSYTDEHMMGTYFSGEFWEGEGRWSGKFNKWLRLTNPDEEEDRYNE